MQAAGGRKDREHGGEEAVVDVVGIAEFETDGDHPFEGDPEIVCDGMQGGADVTAFIAGFIAQIVRRGPFAERAQLIDVSNCDEDGGKFAIGIGFDGLPQIVHQSAVRFAGGRYGGADPEEEVGVGSFSGEILEDVGIGEAFGVSGGIEDQGGPFIVAFEEIGSEGTSAGNNIIRGLEFAEEFVDERGFSGFGLTEDENAEGGLFGEGGVGGGLLGFPFGLRAGEFAGFKFAEIEVAAVEFDGVEASFFDCDLQEPLLEIEFGFLEEFTLGVGAEFANDS